MRPTSPRIFAAISTPQPGSASSRGASGATSLASSCFELVDPHRVRPDVGDQLGGQSHQDCLLAVREPGREPVQLAVAVQATWAGFASGFELVQVPAQPVLHLRARGDQVLTVVHQQSDLANWSVQGCGRQVRLA